MTEISLPTPYVKAVRNLYTAAFQTRYLKASMPKLSLVVQKLIDVIEEKREDGPIDFQSLFVRMSLDAIGALAFDTNLGGLDGSRSLYTSLRQAENVFKLRSARSLKSVFRKIFPNRKEAAEQNAVIDKLNEDWDDLVRDILAKRDPQAWQHPVWDSLRNLKDPETKHMIPYKALISEIATVVVMGMNTTGHQLAWLFALMASHRESVEKLLDELKGNGLYDPVARDLMFEDLDELIYLEAIIKEGMRMGCVHSMDSLRSVPKDMYVLGHRIPKGTVIVCPGSRAMDDKSTWGDPQTFRPDRWLTHDDMSKRYDLGFGIGARDCVGQKLATYVMQLVIVKLLVRYQFFPARKLEETFETAQDGRVIEGNEGICLHVRLRSAF